MTTEYWVVFEWDEHVISKAKSLCLVDFLLHPTDWEVKSSRFELHVCIPIIYLLPFLSFPFVMYCRTKGKMKKSERWTLYYKILVKYRILFFKTQIWFWYHLKPEILVLHKIWIDFYFLLQVCSELIVMLEKKLW